MGEKYYIGFVVIVTVDAVIPPRRSGEETRDCVLRVVQGTQPGPTMSFVVGFNGKIILIYAE